MPHTVRKRHTKHFKAEVAIEALKGQKTITEIASRFKVHPTQVNAWKKNLREYLPELFATNQGKKRSKGPGDSALFEEIGRLKFLGFNLPTQRLSLARQG